MNIAGLAGSDRASARPPAPGAVRLGVVGRWVLALTLALSGAFIATSPAQGAAALTVTWESECEGVKRTVRALIIVPRLLDVCGGPAADVSATFTSSASGGTMHVRKLSHAGEALPLKIEAVIRDPRGPADSEVGFGYDARGVDAASNAPDTFRARLSLSGSGASTTSALTLEITGPGSTLAVTSEVFTRGPDGSRTKPQRLRLGYAPVPSTASATARLGGEGVSLQLGAGTPTSATLLAEDLTVTPQRTLSARVDRLPRSLALEFSEAGGNRQVSYSASELVELVALTADNLPLSGRARRADLLFQVLPTGFTLGLGAENGSVDLELTGGPVGLVQTLLTSGPTESVPADRDGVILRDTAASYVLAARISGLRRVTAQLDPVNVSLVTTAGRPFGLVLDREPTPGAPPPHLAVFVDALPATLTIGANKPDGTLAYAAAAPVGLMTVEASDPAGVFGRGTRLDLALEGIPPALSLGFNHAGALFSVDAGTGTVGSLSALLTTGPTETMPTDSIKLIDTAAQYTVFARITGLKSASVRQRPTFDLQIATAGGRPFRVDLREAQPSGPDQTLTAIVENLPAALSLAFGETPAGGRQLTSVSSSVIGRIALDGANLPLTGRTKRVLLDLNGLPTNLAVDFGSEASGAVTFDTGGAAPGAIEALFTSGPIESLPAGEDGLILRDVPDRYVFAVRGAGLRRVLARQSPLAVSLASTGGQPFRLELAQQAGQKRTFTDLRLQNLPANAQLSLADTGLKTELIYAASSAINRLDLATNSGDRSQLSFSAVPAPASLAVCFDSGSNACGNTARPANKGSLRVTASAPTTLNLFDCRVGPCSSPTEQLRFTNLNVRKLELNLHTEPICVPVVGCGADGAKGSGWLDTDNVVLSGDVFSDGRTQAGAAVEVTTRFPPGFVAQDRFVAWDGPFVDPQGSINCDGTAGDGQNLDMGVEISGATTVDLAFLFC